MSLSRCRIKYEEDNDRPLSSYVSKSAFCQARQKISWDFFRDLSRYLALQAEEMCPNEKLYKNYRLLAVDGTTIALPLTSATAADFGTVKNQYSSQCIPRCSVLMDVLNGWCYNAILGSSTCSEKEQFYEQLDFIPKNSIVISSRT
jgi:hypothetical protein